MQSWQALRCHIDSWSWLRVMGNQVILWGRAVTNISCIDCVAARIGELASSRKANLYQPTVTYMCICVDATWVDHLLNKTWGRFAIWQTSSILRKEDSGFGTTECPDWQVCIEPEGSISNESWTPHQPIADRRLYNHLYANKQDFKQTKSVGLNAEHRRWKTGFSVTWKSKHELTQW